MRPSLNPYFIAIAQVVSTRSTCSRRKVGAVIADNIGHILSTGYNGVPAGAIHCIDKPCKGASLPSGQGLDVCRAQHAEVNAIAHCRDLFTPAVIYVTTSPCMSCAKLIVATRINKVVYAETYDQEALQYLIDSGIAIEEVNQ